MLSEKPWKPEAMVQLILAALTSVCLGVMVGLGVEHATAPWLEEKERKLLNMMVATFFFQGGTLVWIHVFLRHHGMGWREGFGLNHGRLSRVMLIGTGAAFFILPGIWGLQSVSGKVLEMLGHKPELQESVVKLQSGLPWWHQVFLGVMAVVAAPVVEELMFRGIIYPCLKKRISAPLAMWVTSLAFGATHANLMAFLPLVILAMILTWLYEKTDNLAAPILTHAVFNATNFFLILFHDRLPKWLNF